MFYLLEIDFTEKTFQKWYQFTIETNPNWKKSIKLTFSWQNKVLPKENGMDDYSYFKVIKQIEFQNSFFLLKSIY